MDYDVNYEREKTKSLTKMGCLFGVILMGVLMISFIGWGLFRIIPAEETHLLTSRSPDDTNEIEIVMVHDFPDPALHINYQDQTIIKAKIPDDISVKWINDHEANVILLKQGREPDIVRAVFD